MTLFDPSVLRLNHICIHNSSNLSFLGLKVLKNHPISVIEIWGLTNISVNDIISHLSEWTLNNISGLSLHGSLFFSYSSSNSCEEEQERRSKERIKNNFSRKKSNLWSKHGNVPKSSNQSESSEQASAYPGQLCKRNVKIGMPAIYVGLCKLKSLKELNLSDSNIGSHALSNICHDLTLLTLLDISNCSLIESIDCLKYRKDTLLSLNLYNLKVLMMEETKQVLLELKKLLHLDVSKNKNRSDPIMKIVSSQSIIPELLKNPEFVPNIKSIDLSGQEDVTANDLATFLSTHPSPTFLGLMFLMFCIELPKCNVSIF